MVTINAGTNLDCVPQKTYPFILASNDSYPRTWSNEGEYIQNSVQRDTLPKTRSRATILIDFSVPD